jgi:hypothetical protein
MKFNNLSDGTCFRARGLLAAAVVGLSLAAVPRLARADDAEGVQHFERGVALYQDGSLEGALTEFEAAYKITKNFKLLFNIALCQADLGDPVGALASYERYLADGGARVAGKSEQAREQVARLKRMVQPVTITSDAPEGTELFVDNVRVGTLPRTTPLVVKLGTRTFAAKRGEQTVTKAVTIVAGNGPVALPFPPATRPAEAPLVAATSPSPAKAPETAAATGPSAPWLPWTIAGIFGASATVTGLLAIDARNDAARAAATYGARTDAIEGPQKRANSMALATDILLGATVVSAGIATYFTIRWAGADGKTTGRIHLTPRGTGVVLGGEF